MSKDILLPSGLTGRLDPHPVFSLKAFVAGGRRHWYPTVCIYTVNTGKYEGTRILLDNRGKRMGCDVLYFTDDKSMFPRCRKRGLIPIYINRKGHDPKTVQRTIKTSPHLFLPTRYDFSIYVDGNIELFANAGMILRSFNLRHSKLACFCHPVRTTVAEEAMVIIGGKLETKTNVHTILDMLRRSRFPDNVGLTETNILIRRHKEIVAFSNEWTQCVKKCRRDQVSFDYLLWKHGTPYTRYPWGAKPGVGHHHVHGYGRNVS